MNWSRTILGGVVAGIVTNVADFLMHGVMMAETYKRYSNVFTQSQANPLLFGALSIAVALCVAILFAKTRPSWGAGWKGGLAFGFFFGLATFFFNFYYPIVIDGFPYYLGWCWGGIGMIDGLIAGAILGAIVPKS